jgi:hypothetical protein
MSGSEEVTSLLNQLAQGNASQEIIGRLMTLAAGDPALMNRILEGLKAMGADVIGGDPLREIGYYYREKPGLFELRWPLTGHGGVTPELFASLDRKTQFFVLFQEWSARELAAMQCLNGGDTAGAEAIFNECLERAGQIEVAELVARSYEGLMRVAQRLGDSAAAVDWSRRAKQARAAAS